MWAINKVRQSSWKTLLKTKKKKKTTLRPTADNLKGLNETQELENLLASVHIGCGTLWRARGGGSDGGRRVCVVLDGITQMCQSPKEKKKKKSRKSLTAYPPLLLSSLQMWKQTRAEDITEAVGV